MANSKKIKTFSIKNGPWSPDIDRDKEWEKLKVKQNRRHYLHAYSKSLDGDHNEFGVTGDDIKELRACFDLGFGFDPCNELDPKLSRVFPALELYAIVNPQFDNRNLSTSCSSIDFNPSLASLSFVIDTNDDPNITKMRLRRWAQVVAYSIHEACIQPKTKIAK